MKTTKKRVSKYKVRIGKKFITVSPKPDEFIPGGLNVVFDNETETTSPIGFTDLIKGKSRYWRPDRPAPGSFEGRKIVNAYVITL